MEMLATTAITSLGPVGLTGNVPSPYRLGSFASAKNSCSCSVLQWCFIFELHSLLLDWRLSSPLYNPCPQPHICGNRRDATVVLPLRAAELENRRERREISAVPARDAPSAGGLFSPSFRYAAPAQLLRCCLRADAEQNALAGLNAKRKRPRGMAFSGMTLGFSESAGKCGPRQYDIGTFFLYMREQHSLSLVLKRLAGDLTNIGINPGKDVLLILGPRNQICVLNSERDYRLVEVHKCQPELPSKLPALSIQTKLTALKQTFDNSRSTAMLWGSKMTNLIRTTRSSAADSETFAGRIAAKIRPERPWYGTVTYSNLRAMKEEAGTVPINWPKVYSSGDCPSSFTTVQEEIGELSLVNTVASHNIIEDVDNCPPSEAPTFEAFAAPMHCGGSGSQSWMLRCERTRTQLKF